MSLQSDLMTALAAVAGGRVSPDISAEKTLYPLVNYRVLNREPIATIDGVVHATQWQIIFECWAKNYDDALATATAVRAAITASALNYYPISEPGEDYDAQVDSYMVPVYLGFLHV